MKQKIHQILRDAISSAVDAGELSPANKFRAQFYVEPSKDALHGDFASTIALVIAKPEKKPPRQIAETIKRNINDTESVLEKIEIAGPGFLNFFLRPEAWLFVLHDVERQGKSFGHSHAGGGKKVQVEFVSANPTGPLHIGHGRGAAVGDSLARLLAFAGFDVYREFYINDFGSQVENLGASIYMRYRQLAGGEGAEVTPAPVSEADDGRPEAGNLYLGEYVTEIARVFMEDPAFVALPEDGKRVYCREEGIRAMLRQIEDTLARFGVSFDGWYSERSLYGPGTNLVHAAIDELRGKGLVYDEGGAVWLATTRFGDDKDRVLVRKNGQTTYFASDIAYHRDKYGRGFKEIIDIWGADHHGYIPRMKAAVAALGHDPEGFRVLLVQLVNLMRE
ncbi:MAG TPA: arginine--tRNA ligase, partial [Nitrospirota bacterium]|nr:arginine--tRNA ligase [Nitrospirota bacterium]